VEDRNLDEALQRARSRLSLLADLSEALAGTLDAREGLVRVCRLLAQRLGDWCAIDMFLGGDRIQRACTSNGDSDSERREHAVLRGPAQEAAGTLADALRGAKPVLLHAGQLADLPQGSDWEIALTGEFTRYDATSAVIAPIRGRREVMGVLSLARFGGHSPLDEAELAIVEGLAHRVGLALDNARLYAEVEHIAERLQRSLLPELPHLDGLTTAARYLPSGTAAQVGGDWYDLFPLPGGPDALIVGDVVGHDLHAAVSMSQLRNMLRGIACDRQEPPESIIRRIDTAATTLYPGTYATCIYAVLRDDPDDHTRYLDYTSAGHPPPLLIAPDGEARYLEGGHGPLIGVNPRAPRTSATETLPDEATILLYTDGLIERRGETLDHGLTRLRRDAAALANEPPDAVCDHLIDTLAPDDRDDVALLAVRLSPLAT
jgi:serine phosphatase RsbU (regulator of sigma subunit)